MAEFSSKQRRSIGSNGCDEDCHVPWNATLQRVVPGVVLPQLVQLQILALDCALPYWRSAVQVDERRKFMSAR